MKKALIFLLAASFLAFSSCKDVSQTLYTEDSTEETDVTEDEGGTKMRKVINYADMKAIWLSQFDMADVYCVNGKQRSEAEYTRLAESIIGRIRALGFNTVIIQIRPYGDSFYPSGYYPASRFVTGSYANGFSYDPVGIFVSLAHSAELSVQAWINPLRLMREDEIGGIDASNVLKKWYVEGKLKTFEERLYLDPAYEDARALIADGAREALEKYDFDGLHIDDYFYPTTDASFDGDTFGKSGEASLDEFRINNIDSLVKGLYDEVKSVDERLIFGVSPSGNLGTLKQKYYADAEKWCSSDGFIDYIMPQIYFGLKHAVCPFAETCEKWKSIIKNENIRLYVGMTLGKAVNGAKGIEDMYGGSGKREWIEDHDVIRRCFEYLGSSSAADGISIFCYQYFYDPVSGKANEYSASEVAAFLPYLEDKEA